MVSPNTLDKISPSRWNDIRALYKDNPKGLAESMEWQKSYFFHDRDYALFAMLSNVRNDGSIDHLTDDQLNGEMPYDASDKVANHYRHWGQDAHSLTILTLEELLVDNKDFWDKHTQDYDGKTVKYRELCEDFYKQIVEVANYAKWKNLDKWRIVCWYDN